MNSLNIADEIEKNRLLLLQAEVCGLLHDIGKLSNIWLEYRRGWREGERWKYGNDPHDHKFLENSDYDNVIKDFRGLKNVFDQYHITIAVHEHTAPQTPHLLDVLNMLKAADGVDAAIDRNNPLWSAEQKGKIFHANVYGYEGKEVPENLDALRQELYQFLAEGDQLKKYLEEPNPKTRRSILNKIEAIFSQTLSDTTRPQNDTSLWEHCYAVASIYRVLHLHKIIYDEPIDQFQKVRFGILGIGWDGVKFMSAGHKIGDVLGRKKLIDELKLAIKELVEYELLLGNCVYEDDNFLCFLVPALGKFDDLDTFKFARYQLYDKHLKEMEKKIIEKAVAFTGGDLLPHFYLVPDTRYLTHILKCLNGLKEKVKMPVRFPLHSEVVNEVAKEWKDTYSDVCPVCGLRPVKNDGKICTICEERRTGRALKAIAEKETPFISEIVLGNKSPELKRAALIVARFDLSQWLNGKMERTLFVSEARGREKELEDLGNTKDENFKDVEENVREALKNHPAGNLITAGYDYHRITREIDLCYRFEQLTDENEKEYAKYILFLYDQRVKQGKMNRNPEQVHEIWDNLKRAAIEEYELEGAAGDWLLPNLICTKTPTPSTVLDTWMTTKEFFEEIDIKGIVGERKRAKFEIAQAPTGITQGAVYYILVNGEKIEVVISKDEKWLRIISEPYDKVRGITGEVAIYDADTDKKVGSVALNSPAEEAYYPCRSITRSPELFLAIVPADKAEEITRKLYEEFVNRFGKVMGRLPFAVGNIFFDQHMPMFIVLDAARRTLRSFEKLTGEKMRMRISKKHQPLPLFSPNQTFELDKIGKRELEIKWEVPYKLGNDEPDFHHPYYIVPDDSERYSYRKSYFKTIAGNVVHFSEIQPGDEVLVYPCYYDYEYLDATVRRYDLLIEKDGRRKGVLKLKTRPFLIEELLQSVEKVWRGLKGNSLLPGLTDTQLRHLESLWIKKLQEWGIKLPAEFNQQFLIWAELVETSLIRAFPDLAKLEKRQDLGWLESLIFSGIFFETLELKTRVLKERIKEE